MLSGIEAGYLANMSAQSLRENIILSIKMKEIKSILTNNCIRSSVLEVYFTSEILFPFRINPSEHLGLFQPLQMIELTEGTFLPNCLCVTVPFIKIIFHILLALFT